MKLTVLSLCVVLYVAPCSVTLAVTDTSDPKQCRWTINKGGNHIEVLLEKARLRREGYTFTRSKTGEVLINGVRAVGTDALSADYSTTQLVVFQVNWNGRTINVGKCFNILNPSLKRKRNSSDSGSVLVKLSENQQAVLVELGGGDAAGSFTAWWIVRRDGVIDRFLESESD
jgi:hypothetical protein